MMISEKLVSVAKIFNLLTIKENFEFYISNNCYALVTDVRVPADSRKIDESTSKLVSKVY